MTNRRNRTLSPAIPFVFLHAATAHIVTNVPAPIEWSHSHFITSDFQFTDDTTRVTLNRATGGSIYRLYAQAGATKKVGAPEYMALQLYINGVAQDCCLSHGAVSTTGSHGDTTLIAAFYANAGDYIEIYAWVDVGTADLEDNTARIIIEGLPMRGWNNESGGKDRVKGGRR